MSADPTQKKSGLRGTVWALELCHWKKTVFFLFFASPWAIQKGPKILESQIFILLNLIWVESEQLAKFGVSKSKTVVADGEHMKRQTEKHDFWLFAPQKGPKNFWISNFYPLKPVLCRKWPTCKIWAFQVQNCGRWPRTQQQIDKPFQISLLPPPLVRRGGHW